MSQWTTHTSADGRTYWHNTQTQASVWEKPDELKTEADKALGKTGWKEYDTNGKKYWYHKEKGATTWEMPDEVKRWHFLSIRGKGLMNEALEDAGSLPTLPPVSTPLLLPGPNLAAALPARPLVSTTALPGGGPGAVVPSFNTLAEAEKAFFGLLRTVGVTVDHTWEQTMKLIITDPLYKALPTLSDRKNAWAKYIEELKAAKKSEREKNLERCRPAWKAEFERLEREERELLSGGGEDSLLLRGGEGNKGAVKGWWTWEGLGKQQLEKRMREEVWKMARDDGERIQLFNEHTAMLKDQEVTRLKETRTNNMAKLTNLFKSLNIDLLSLRWRDAQQTVVRTEEWKEDATLRSIEDIDFLITFEDAVKDAERAANEGRQKAKDEKKRRARKNREAFLELLAELKEKGKLKARARWSDVYRDIEEDIRYENMLGNPGSTPLELFFDAVDECDAIVEKNQSIVEGIFAEMDHGAGASKEGGEGMEVDGEEKKADGEGDTQKKGFQVREETTWEDFFSVLGQDDRIKSMSESDLRDVYTNMHEEAVHIARENRRKAEKRLRNQIEDLRYALRKSEPAFTLDMSFQDAVPLMETIPEYVALTNMEGRKEAFEKHMKRLKEKQREKEREAERKREKEHVSDTDSAHTSTRKRRRSVERSPEKEKDRTSKKEKERDRKYREKDRDGDVEMGDGEKKERSSRRDSHAHARDRDRDYDDEKKHRSSRTHREKEKDEKRERDSHRDRDRERDRERDRDRDRDRDGHRDKDRRSSRRDEKEDEERKKRKESDGRVRDDRPSKRVKEDSDLEEGEI
ncbi:hypothetical protein BT69DRAFT_1325770 [Atractiella rhizophila]|nr:hypothetical protein BT69DRAFT_1325770 [Atractiella rhizophila]